VVAKVQPPADDKKQVKRSSDVNVPPLEDAIKKAWRDLRDNPDK
jgi:hypothetical protein